MKIPTPVSPNVWLERYEALRAQALGHNSGQALGLVLFLRQGMTAWMAAWERLVPTIQMGPSAAVAQNGSSANNLSSDLSILLANMALRQLEAHP